ncbi:MAG: helix-turn-helix transcriptional regulator [Clostridiales bacterium]|nr:helix-turn-helix transcriptional regulator [Clostridiales bacterium]
MADSVAMNAAYFSRFFKRHTGEHFAEYLAKRRMEKAIELLRDPRYKVFEISPMVGYFSKQNFYRRFRQHTGRTPIEYRNEVLMIQDDDE